MDIIVEGIGKKFYTPDEVEINLDFYTRADSYEKSLEDGTKNVEIFINEVLEKLNLNKEIMKTRSFRIYEEKNYDYEKKMYLNLGYAYSQHANMKIDYDMKSISEFMERVSKLDNPPRYHLSFGVKNIKNCKDEVISEAYNKAKEKADAIAKSAGKELKECVKIDFRPFEESVISKSSLNSKDMYMQEDMQTEGAKFGMAKTRGIQEKIQTIFTPEDVEITEVLYCLWITN